MINKIEKMEIKDGDVLIMTISKGCSANEITSYQKLVHQLVPQKVHTVILMEPNKLELLNGDKLLELGLMKIPKS